MTITRHKTSPAVSTRAVTRGEPLCGVVGTHRHDARPHPYPCTSVSAYSQGRDCALTGPRPRTRKAETAHSQTPPNPSCYDHQAMCLRPPMAFTICRITSRITVFTYKCQKKRQSCGVFNDFSYLCGRKRRHGQSMALRSLPGLQIQENRHYLY